MSVYAGAVTALSLRGLGQYLPLGGNAEIYLLNERRERLPSWFVKHAWSGNIRYRCLALFNKPVPSSFSEIEHEGFPVRVSAPERAILEVFHLATKNDAIEQALEIMEGLSTLRPQVLQLLLEACQSVKVKRLFLWSAETAGHDWFKRLSIPRIDLGKGKRVIYQAGHFDQNYQITVPKQKDMPDV